MYSLSCFLTLLLGSVIICLTKIFQFYLNELSSNIPCTFSVVSHTFYISYLSETKMGLKLISSQTQILLKLILAQYLACAYRFSKVQSNKYSFHFLTISHELHFPIYRPTDPLQVSCTFTEFDLFISISVLAYVISFPEHILDLFKVQLMS